METAWIADGTRILQAFGWTLIHSLWQAAIVYTLLSILLKSAPGLPARVRYACASLALPAIAIWAGHTLLRHWPAAIRLTDATQAGAYRPDMRLPVMRELDEIMPWLMMAYGLGLGLMLGRLMLGFSELRRLRNSGHELEGELLVKLQRLARSMGVRYPVRLRQSPAVTVPMVLGMLRPVILLPPTCLENLSPAALDAVLLHELAHIRRADFIVNVLQSIVEALFFFNPFVQRIGAIMRREREHSCDDLVVAQSVHPLEYAAALASLAAAGRTPAFALAAADGRYPLLHRIKRITSMEKKSFRPGTVIIVTGIAALMIAISIICFTPAFAQRKAKTAASSSHPAPPAPPAPGAVVIPPTPPAAPGAAVGVGAALSALDGVLATMPAMGDSIAEVTREALRQVDWDQIRREVQQASKEIEAIDWKEIERETRNGIAQARREIDRAQIGKSIEAALAEVDRVMAELPEPPEAPEPGDRKDRGLQADLRRQAADARRAEADERRAAADELRSRADERRAEAGSSRAKARDQRAAASERLAEARAEMEQARRELDEAQQEMEAARKELERAKRERQD